jgi:biotin-(acetyl-CoA carboxylase) ligase
MPAVRFMPSSEEAPMRIMSDVPGRIRDFVPAGVRWHSIPAESLIAEERLLWHALGSGSDLWIAEKAAPNEFWKQAVVVGEAPVSQFDVLRDLVRNRTGPIKPTACAALEGRNFHGQRGRHWAAAPGNLHLCAAIRPSDMEARFAVGLTMIPAVAVVHAVRRLTGGAVRPGIKWVNDILMGGNKIAGVLTHTQSRGALLVDVVFGIGLNIAQTPEVPWTPFVPAIGCLAQAGFPVSLASAFAAVLEEIAVHLQTYIQQGPGPLFELYRSCSMVIGREVCIWDDEITSEPDRSVSAPPRVRGIVREILPDLSLVVEGADAPVTRGRLAFAESCPLQ